MRASDFSEEKPDDDEGSLRGRGQVLHRGRNFGGLLARRTSVETLERRDAAALGAGRTRDGTVLLGHGASL